MSESDRNQQTERAQVLIEIMQREAVAQGPVPPRTPDEEQYISCSELPEETEGPIAREWNLYRREVGRLLAEGHEGRWILIKGDEIVGIWDSRSEAQALSQKRYLMQPVLLRQILAREPLLRIAPRIRQCLG
jgi:hypothetical protein